MSDQTHVILTTDKKQADKYGLRGHVVLPGGKPKAKYCASYEYDPTNALGPSAVRVVQPEPYEGTKKVDWRALEKLPQLLCVQPRTRATAMWIMRRRVVEPVLARVPADELRLHAAALVDGRGTIDDDWVMLDIRATYPIDRDASTARYQFPANPHASSIEALDELRWSPGNEPPYAIARVGEYPHLTIVRRDVFALLAKAVKKVITQAVPPYSSDDWRPIDNVNTITTWQSDPCRETTPIPSSPSVSKRAADAFWRLRAGEKARRGDVLASPHYAYWLARLVDREPRDDTRTAACAQAFCAWIYARDVDTAPTPDTRRAARGNAAVARLFATTVKR